MKKNSKNFIEKIASSKTLTVMFLVKFIIGIIAGIIVFFIFIHMAGRYLAISNGVMTGNMDEDTTPYLYSEAQDIIGSVIETMPEHNDKMQESIEKGAELEERVSDSRQEFEEFYDKFNSYFSSENRTD